MAMGRNLILLQGVARDFGLFAGPASFCQSIISTRQSLSQVIAAEENDRGGPDSHEFSKNANMFLNASSDVKIAFAACFTNRV